MYVGIFAAAFLVLAFLTLTLVIYLKVFYGGAYLRDDDPYAGLKSPYLEGMREVIKTQIDELSTHPCEDIYIKGHKGTKLHGRYYAAEDSSKVAILFHGYKGSSHTELSGTALMMLAHGISVIAVDQRAHGKSRGVSVSFGIMERFDCAAWAKYAEERFGEDTKIFLFGISMGAATVLMASELSLPTGVRAIIADCPYSTPSAIIKRVLANRGLSPKKVYPLVFAAGVVWGRFNLRASSPKEAVKRAKVPILLVHGEADDFVPCDMSKEIHASCTSKKVLFTVEGAKHGASFAVGQENYVRALLSFIDEA